MAKNNTPNPTDGRMKDKEVNAISDYLKPNIGQFTRNYTQTTKRGLLTTNKG